METIDYKSLSVLVLDGASRQILPILSGLHKLGCDITTINAKKLDNGYVSRYPDHKLIIPQGKDYYEYVLELVTDGKYDVLIPLSDFSTDLITQHLDEISKYVKTPIPSREIFLRAYDKQKTMEICMDNDIPCPITKKDGESVDEFAARIGFPLIAKPRMACGSMGLKIVKSLEQLHQLIDEGQIELDKYVIQEFIPQTGTQYNIHLFMDDEGGLPSCLVTEKSRWYPIDGGASCMCRTTENAQVATDSGRLLRAVKWRGYCEIEMIMDPRDGIAKIMEINGRASASIKIMELAGINVARQMLDLCYGSTVETYLKAENDIRMRCLLTDVLWLIQSPDRFTRKPSWFSIHKTHDVLFSMKDPLPFFTYTIESVPQYRQAMKKRKRD